MNDRNRLEILNYWINNPVELSKIPKNLKDKISEYLSLIHI